MYLQLDLSAFDGVSEKRPTCKDTHVNVTLRAAYILIQFRFTEADNQDRALQNQRVGFVSFKR